MNFADRYRLLLCGYVVSPSEHLLCAAAELGRELVTCGEPPETVARLHECATAALAAERPGSTLAEVAPAVNAVLGEVLMAHGLAFRAAQQRGREDEARERARHARQLESLGTLAGGVAHDFNGIAGLVLGFAELLADEVPAGGDGAEYLRQIRIAAERARALVTRLLAFARQAPLESSTQDLGPLVEECLMLLTPSIPPAIAVTRDIDQGVAAEVDAEQFRQVVMNLVGNALQALGERSGTLQVALKAQSRNGRAGALLTVADSGCGISPEVRHRIFEPFFTSRQGEQGTGLGLAMVHGIVSAHHGTISVDSAPGMGATFSVWWPAAAAP